MAKEAARVQEAFYSVKADAKFHVTVPEGTEGAVYREYTLTDKKTKVESTAGKYELLYSALSGKITEVTFFEGEYGKSLILTLEDEGEEPIKVALDTNSNFGEDMLKKLMNVDVDQPVRLVPYALTDEKTGKEKRGMTVYQGQDEDGKFLKEDENKVQSYFHKWDEKSKTTLPLHGYPKAPVAKKGKEVSKDEWKIWFAQCRVFMIEAIEEHFEIDTEEESTPVEKRGNKGAKKGEEDEEDEF